MAKDTVTIPKTEYEELKRKAQESDNLLHSFLRGINDIEKGKVKEWKSQ